MKLHSTTWLFVYYKIFIILPLMIYLHFWIHDKLIIPLISCIMKLGFFDGYGLMG